MDRDKISGAIYSCPRSCVDTARAYRLHAAVISDGQLGGQVRYGNVTRNRCWQQGR